MANLDIGFYVSLFRRRLAWFVLVVVAVLATGLAIIWMLPPAYVATARLLVESPQIPTDLARSTVPTGAMEQFQIIQQDVLSRDSLVALADKFGLYRNRPEFDQTEIVTDMRKRIEVTPIPMQSAAAGATTVFEVSFTANDAQTAAGVTNDLVGKILARDVELRTARAADTLKFFTQEVDRLNGELKKLDAAILDFQNSHINALPDSLNFRRSQQINQQQQLLLLQQEEDSLHRQQAILKASHPLPGTAAQTPEEKTLADLRQSLASQLTVFSEQSPTVRTLRARIAALESQIGAGGAGNEDASGNAPPSSLQLQLAGIEDRLDEIARQKKSIAVSSAELARTIEATPANETTLNALERNQKNVQAQYDAAVARLAEASTGEQIEARLKGERLSLVESALPPQKPAKPNRLMLMAMAFIGALALGLATVALPEFLNRTIRRPTELVEKLDIRPIVAIPYIVTSSERNRRRMASAATLVLVAGVIPILIVALNLHVGVIDVLVNRALTGLGSGPVH